MYGVCKEVSNILSHSLAACESRIRGPHNQAEGIRKISNNGMQNGVQRLTIQVRFTIHKTAFLAVRRRRKNNGEDRKGERPDTVTKTLNLNTALAWKCISSNSVAAGLIGELLRSHRPVAGGDPETAAALIYGFAGAGDLLDALLAEVKEARRRLRDDGEAFAERGEPGREDMERVDRDGVKEEGEGKGASLDAGAEPEEDSFRRNSTQR